MNETIATDLQYFLSVKNDFISFFLSSGTHQSHHLIGCHATDSFATSQILCYRFFATFMLHRKFFADIFPYCFTLLKFITSSQTSDMNNIFKIIFIKINIIKVNFIKIYTKNTHLICKKCDTTKIFIKKHYVIIRE